MIRINLLPVREERRRKGTQMQLAMFAGILAIALAACAGWYLYHSTTVSSQKDTIAKNESEIKGLKEVIGTVTQLEEKKKKLNEQLDVIAQLERGKRGPVRVLDELSKATPKRVWITEFDEKAGQLKLKGVGLENSDISDFLRALQKSKYFDNVRLGFTQSETKNSVQIVNFTIECRVLYSA